MVSPQLHAGPHPTCFTMHVENVLVKLQSTAQPALTHTLGTCCAVTLAGEAHALVTRKLSAKQSLLQVHPLLVS